MGMGRNIFRRLFLVFILNTVFLQGETLPVKQNIIIEENYLSESIEAKNSLRSTMKFSFPFEMNAEIEKQIEIFSSEDKLQFLKRALNRAAPFKSYILSLIREYNLPVELYYLPVLESAYRVNAVSRSGAVGMWQFMENSIAPYDITIDEWRDDRRDFWRSTDGALRKLLYNYNRTGNWHLALAAYNCGLNGLNRVIRSSGINDYWELAEKELIPYETRNYLSKFIAISIICSYPERYGLETSWEDNVEWTRIDLDRSVDLRIISEQCGIDYNLLVQGNAELIYEVTPPAETGYKLKIPQVYADSLINILKNRENSFIEFYRYNIKTGDTLSEISEYYKVPLNLVYKYNEGLSPRYLRTGQTVLIPALADVEPYRADEENNVSFDNTYIVRQGDSLWSISGRYSITPELLAVRNRLPVEGTLNIGMKLSVPVLE